MTSGLSGGCQRDDRYLDDNLKFIFLPFEYIFPFKILIIGLSIIGLTVIAEPYFPVGILSGSLAGPLITGLFFKWAKTFFCRDGLTHFRIF